MFAKAEKSTFPYWFAHVLAYNMTALNVKSWKFKYLFHDIEKPFLKLFMPYEKVRNRHRTNHNHHPEWLENRLKKVELLYGCVNNDDVKYLLDRFDFQGAIIDWECSRFTKEDQPLNAHDEYKRLLTYNNFKEKYPFITKYCYNEFSKRLMDAIKKLGLENND